MKRLILFRYHDYFDICIENIKLLKKLNPNCEILGLYGGDLDNLPSKKLLNLFDYNYNIPLEDAHYKWMHGDLCIRNWFKNEGYKLDFDVVNILEWDMMLLKPLDELYTGSKYGLAVTECFSYKEAKSFNWHWVFDLDWQWDKQLKEVEKIYGRINPEDLTFGIFGGLQLPREFLVRYILLKPSSYTNDEARLFLYAQAMGFKIYDNGLHNDKNIFEADDYDKIDTSSYVEKVKKGAIALHPVRDLKLMKEIIRECE